MLETDLVYYMGVLVLATKKWRFYFLAVWLLWILFYYHVFIKKQ